jgi:hypothetical protein
MVLLSSIFGCSPPQTPAPSFVVGGLLIHNQDLFPWCTALDLELTSSARQKPSALHLLKRCLQGSGTSATPLVVDVGSNVGWMTFAAAKMGARVIAFEGRWRWDKLQPFIPFKAQHLLIACCRVIHSCTTPDHQNDTWSL